MLVASFSRGRKTRRALAATTVPGRRQGWWVLTRCVVLPGEVAECLES